MLCNMTCALSVAVLCAVMFLYFIFNNLIAMRADISAPMNAACILGLTFAVPFLTMRQFAEEKRQRTDQLYMCAPVRLREVVLGKFLAVAAVLFVPALVACILPLILLPFGGVQLLYCYTAIFGYVLYALMVTSIGLLISALCTNPFVAGICTFLVILFGCILGSAYSGIGIAPVRKVLSAVYDFQSAISGLMGGLFDWKSVVYFVSVTVLFLFLCVCVLQAARSGTHDKRTVRRIALRVLLAFALAVIVNALMLVLPERTRSFDVTGSGLYSISEASKEVARGTEDEITLYLIAPEGEGDGKDLNIERVLMCYAQESENIRLTYINPVIYPQFYMDYSDTRLSLNSVVVKNETTGEYRTFDLFDLIETQFDPVSLNQYVTGYDAEGQITGALQALNRDTQVLNPAYLLEGHGEAGFEEAFLRIFSRSGYALSGLNLMTAPGVPEDATLLVIYAPVTDLAASEADKILAYADNGGTILVITDYQAQPDMPELARIAAAFATTINRGLVVETDPEGYYYSGTFAAPFYIYPLVVPDEMTDHLTDAPGGSVFVPMSESFSVREEAGITQLPLLITSENAFLKTDLSDEDVTFREGDLMGRQILALRCEKVLPDGREARAVFFGSEQLFTEAADTQYALGMNARLLGNTLAVLSPEETSFVTIPVKSFAHTLSIRADQMIAISVVLILTIPFLIVCGLIVWFLRRKL